MTEEATGAAPTEWESAIIAKLRAVGVPCRQVYRESLRNRDCVGLVLGGSDDLIDLTFCQYRPLVVAISHGDRTTDEMKRLNGALRQLGYEITDAAIETPFASALRASGVLVREEAPESLGPDVIGMFLVFPTHDLAGPVYVTVDFRQRRFELAQGPMPEAAMRAAEAAGYRRI